MKRVISYTGSPGTGKSTDAIRIYHELNISRPTASIRLFCNLEQDCPFPTKTHTTEAAQLWMFANRIQAELVALSKCDILVTDRTIVDVVAYTYCTGFQDLAGAMLGLAEQHVGHYSEINFKQVKDNPFCCPDSIRDIQDADFRMEVEKTLTEMYRQLESQGFITGSIYYV